MKLNRNVKIHNQKQKARQAVYDEAPELEPGSPAIWHSRNGKRDVTIVELDLPNNRAKINTDKGATMYVPIDTLEKDVDYGKFNLNWR